MKGHYFFFAGDDRNVKAFIDCFFGKMEDHAFVASTAETDCIVFDGKRVLNGGIDEHGYYLDPDPVTRVHAIGSGAPYALAAMDMGANARKAVKVAMKRDNNTGGKINTFKVTT